MSGETVLFIFFTVWAFVLMILVNKAGYDNGYKKGQVEALNGNIEFVLVEFKDGSRDYYKRSELKNLVEHKIINQAP
jgi:hypothetical protein